MAHHGHRCLHWGVLGAILGFACIAYGQQDAIVQAAPSEYDFLARLVSSLGLPGVMAYTAYNLGRWRPTLHVSLSLEGLDASALRRVLAKLEREDEG